MREKLQARASAVGFELSPMASLRTTQDSIRALMLIRAYRVMGHLAADLDPLGLTERKIHKELHPETYGFTEADLDRPIFIDKVLGLEMATIRADGEDPAPHLLRPDRRRVHAHHRRPSRSAGCRSASRAATRRSPSRAKARRAILNKLIEAEGFEKFLDVKYTGTKRFGLDGGEAMIPALEQIIKRGGQLGVQGDRARHGRIAGRLNVLANVMSKPYRAIFHEFQGGSLKPDDVEGSGDVKYHLGASSRPRVRRQQRAPVADRQPVASRDRQSGGAGQGARQAGPARRQAGRAHAGAAAADPRRRGLRRPGRGRRMLRPVRARRATAPAAPIHFIVNNQIGFTTAPALLALLALLLGRRPDGARRRSST